jgi:serine/threonine-protein kinase
MATVYLAEDLKHQRKVAIKVLRPELAAMLGADRFVQEITTTAALQHPHILPLFDSGESDGFLWYAMPFIDGETLRAKLDRESQLGVAEAVRITREVADALDYAHRQGVVHRDIKPENILLHDGRPMVADFGIALALSAAAGGRMTETGMSLGTPHYMSPEQATAEKEVSNRSDIYSLGSVLYEMLAGQPPHLGGTAQQIIMKIIAEEAQPVTKLRKSVPPNVAAAVATSLGKLPADRFDSARAFAEALADPHYGEGRAATPGVVAAARSRGLASALAVALVVALVVLGWTLTRPAPPGPVIRYGLMLPANQAPISTGFALITSDGAKLVYLGTGATGGAGTLWVKRREELTATPIAGTEGTTSAAISPDDRALAIVQGPYLRKVPLNGGASVQLAEGLSNEVGGVTWLADGTLLYVSRDGTRSRIMRIAETGGEPTEVWSSDEFSAAVLTPLLEGRGALFQACARPCTDAAIWVLDLERGEARSLVPNARAAYHLDSGHLVFVRNTDLQAVVVPFDLDQLAVRGDGRVVADSVAVSGGISAYFAISSSGTMVMRKGAGPNRASHELVRVDRQGRATAIDPDWTFRHATYAGNQGWAVSPDGSRIAIGRNTEFGDDIWVKPLSSAPELRVTTGSEAEFRPRWTADGRAVTFVTETGLHLKRADGVGRDSLLLAGAYDEGVLSPDREWILYRQGARSPAAGFRDIMGIRPGVDTAPVTLVGSPLYDEMAIALSPDGRWLAYQSDETGSLEIYMRPFPDTEAGRWPVSRGGGTGPVWSRDGRELFYRSGADSMMAVRITTTPTVEVGPPESLFWLPPGISELNARFYTPWDVTPKGDFIMSRQLDTPDEDVFQLIVVENWLEELKAVMAR